MDTYKRPSSYLTKLQGVTAEDIAVLHLRRNILCIGENGAITIYVFYAE